MPVIQHHGRRAARPQHAVDLIDRPLQVSGVVEAADRHDVVEARVVVRQSECGCLDDASRISKTRHLQPSPHQRDGFRGDVDAVVLGATFGEQLPESPESEPHLEDASPGEPLLEVRGQVRVVGEIGLVEAREIFALIARDADGLRHRPPAEHVPEAGVRLVERGVDSHVAVVSACWDRGVSELTVHSGSCRKTPLSKGAFP